MNIAKEKKNPTKLDLDSESKVEKILEELLAAKYAGKDDWVEKGLPKLEEEILASHEEMGLIEHLDGKDLPSKESVIRCLKDLLTILFPGYLGKTVITRSNIRLYTDKTLRGVHKRLVKEIDRSLKYICIRELKCPMDVCHRLAEIVVGDFMESIPVIRDLLRGDIQAAYDGDPAARNVDEIILSYPCVLAISTYRIAHELYTRGVPIVPRIMSEYAHSTTGIDIHPGAEIGRNFFIDHGTGVVVGETTKIGNNVRIYQGVTLGAMSIPRGGQEMRGMKRHPTIEDDVIIYSGATILGGDTVVGRGSVIGGNVWVTSTVPHSTIVTVSPPELVYKNLVTAHNTRDTAS